MCIDGVFSCVCSWVFVCARMMCAMHMHVEVRGQSWSLSLLSEEGSPLHQMSRLSGQQVWQIMTFPLFTIIAKTGDTVPGFLWTLGTKFVSSNLQGKQLANQASLLSHP